MNNKIVSEQLTDEELEDILGQHSGKICALCGHKISNGEEMAYGDKPHCCKKHGYINLCPKHQDWWHINESNGIIQENTCLVALDNGGKS